MAKSIKEITDIIIDFTEARGWKNENPQSLMNSIIIEFGELAEHYQWKDKFPKFSEIEKTEIGYEFVDIIFYLFRFAEHSGIDIEKYFDEKLPKLAEKFPIGSNAKQRHKEYRLSGKNKYYD